MIYRQDRKSLSTDLLILRSLNSALSLHTQKPHTAKGSLGDLTHLFFTIKDHRQRIPKKLL